MRKGELYSRYQDVIAREKAFLVENSQWIAESTKAGMPIMASGLRRTLTPNGRTILASYVAPRPSHRLFEIAYEHIPQNTTVRRTNYLDQIGRLILPMSGTIQQRSVPVFARQVKKSGDACDKAEDHFRNTLTQIRTGRATGQKFVNVIHSQDGRPLILQKKLDSPTGLTLVPMTFDVPNGQESRDLPVHVPAGTIVAASSGGVTRRAHRSNNDAFDYETTPVTEALITPLRISPWAYDDPLDRAAFAIQIDGHTEEPIGYDRARATMLEHRSLEHFQAAAVRVMELCGVSPNV